MRARNALLCFSFCVASAYATEALAGAPPASAGSTVASSTAPGAGQSLQQQAIEERKLRNDDERVRLENAKLKLEEKRVENESFARLVAIVAAAVSLLVGAGTITASIWIASRQARSQANIAANQALQQAELASKQASHQAELASRQATMQANLKALEFVISAPGPGTARKRLEIVRQLLGPEMIVNGEDLEKLVLQGVGSGHDQNRKDLMKMLIDNPDRQAEVLALWDITFGTGGLAPNLKSLREHLSASSPKAAT